MSENEGSKPAGVKDQTLTKPAFPPEGGEQKRNLAYLVVLAGVSAGEMFRLQDDRTVVGRGCRDGPAGERQQQPGQTPPHQLASSRPRQPSLVHRSASPQRPRPGRSAAYLRMAPGGRPPLVRAVIDAP